MHPHPQRGILQEIASIQMHGELGLHRESQSPILVWESVCDQGQTPGKQMQFRSLTIALKTSCAPVAPKATINDPC